MIQKAIDILRMREVLLQSASVRGGDRLLPPSDSDLSLIPQYQAIPVDAFDVVEVQMEDGSTENTVVFRFRVAIRLVDASGATVAKAGEKVESEPNKGDVHLEIRAQFNALYQLRPNTDVDAVRPALEEFARCNVGFHVWPYWREYVQSTCARMGIPTIPVSMYRLPRQEQEQGKEGVGTP